MERLTANKTVSEMGMYELAHNCCFIDEDGAAVYRDFDTTMDARDLARRLYRKYMGENPPDDDEGFDEYILDDLALDVNDPAGLIALFYRNLWAMADLRERLKTYEDAEEQGLLLRLPCRLGSVVYLICSRYTKCTENEQEFDEYSCQGCECLECDSHREYYIYENNSVSLEWIVRKFGEFGKTVFLTREEAEQALTETKGQENEKP